MSTPPRTSNQGKKLGRVIAPERLRPNWRATLDVRHKANRWLIEREAAYVEHLGGIDNVTVAQSALTERLVHLEVLLGVLECDIRDGKPVDVLRYTSLVDRHAGLLKTLGIKRTARRIESLQDFLAAPAGERSPPSKSAPAVRSIPREPEGGGA